MNVRQKQWQLYCLGYLGSDPSAIDGRWGPQSAGATRAFQQAAGLEADGIFGISTEAASRERIQALQEQVGVPADGLGGPVTLAALRAWDRTPAAPPGQSPQGDFWPQIPNFTRQEFACKCGRYCDGFPAQPREALVRIAQAVRDHFGRPVTIVSGLRCPRHNAAVGGVANSQHMSGEACDLAAAGVGSFRLHEFLRTCPGVRYAYRINETNVHFDIPRGGS